MADEDQVTRGLGPEERAAQATAERLEDLWDDLRQLPWELARPVIVLAAVKPARAALIEVVSELARAEPIHTLIRASELHTELLGRSSPGDVINLRDCLVVLSVDAEEPS